MRFTTKHGVEITGGVGMSDKELEELTFLAEKLDDVIRNKSNGKYNLIELIKLGRTDRREYLNVIKNEFGWSPSVLP